MRGRGGGELLGRVGEARGGVGRLAGEGGRAGEGEEGGLIVGVGAGALAAVPGLGGEIHWFGPGEHVPSSEAINLFSISQKINRP